MIGSAERQLIATQNPDGGWGPHAGRTSATEATALVTLALGHLDGAAARASAARGLRWLTAHQLADGGWPVNTRVDDASWVTALAVLATDTMRADTAAIAGGRWLMRDVPRTLGLLASVLHRFAPAAQTVRLDPDLKGWSWTLGATSFVEPTCYALLALQRLRRHGESPAATRRIAEAERMVYDRMCPDGGWNYGNSTVFGVDLPPFADVTALALFALSHYSMREENQRSLRRLRAMLQHVDSGLSLAWAALCFAAYGEDAAVWRRRVADRYGRTAFLGDTKVLALALLALTQGAEALRA